MDSAAALKCNGCGLESFLAGHFGKGSVHLGFEHVEYVNVRGSVHWECRLRVQIFTY